MHKIALLLLAFWCTALQATEDRHKQLAVEFDALAIDAEKAISEVVDMTIRQMPELGASRAELMKQLREFCAQPRVVEERVRKHMSQFSLVELEQIVPVLKSPGYLLLGNR